MAIWDLKQEYEAPAFSPVSELAEPGEGLGILHLLLDELLHHVPGMHVDGADGHDPLTVSFGELAQ